MKDVLTPFYATKCMEKMPAQDPVALSKKLDIQKIYYDVNMRNQIVLKSSNSFDF